jgi:nucleoside-diphosphate-sugar epimerase
MKVLVTGGSGFIGTNMISLLIEKGFDVINYDTKMPKINSHIKFWVEVDICNKSEILTLITKDNPDYIIHLAARTDLNEKNDLGGYRTNIDGVRNIMDAAASLISLKRIIIASSMLVCKLGFIPSRFDEYAPNSLYGESKVLTEKIVMEYNIDWIIVRPTSIWGPWFGEPYKNFFDLVLNGFYFNIPSRVASTKTYGYVGNTCKQLLNLLTTEDLSVKHNYFYLGDVQPINITEWAIRIRKLNNQSSPLIMPLWFLKLAAIFGDFTNNFFGLSKFPMNSFRYNNMTNNNIIEDIKRTNKITGCGKDSNLDNEIIETLNWLKQFNKQKNQIK